MLCLKLFYLLMNGSTFLFARNPIFHDLKYFQNKKFPPKIAQYLSLFDQFMGEGGGGGGGAQKSSLHKQNKKLRESARTFLVRVCPLFPEIFKEQQKKKMFLLLKGIYKYVVTLSSFWAQKLENFNNKNRIYLAF